MASVLKFLKRHIIAIIILIIFLIIGIVLFIFVRQILGSGNEGTIYGNRLDGIEKIGLKNETLDKISTEIKKNEFVKKVTYRVEGRTINYTVDVAPNTTIENSKKVAEPILATLNNEEKTFYDIQIFVTCNEAESEGYPINGYKHRTSSEFVW
ncbi:MAG: hypothetical protein HFH09_00210 [Bacilli bacterium]|jgi:hypothetical protein|nr:hypothetical protein [Bacilli bacterium]